MTKQSQQSVAVLLAMVVLCVAMAVQVDASRRAPAPNTRGHKSPAHASSHHAPGHDSTKTPAAAPVCSPTSAPAYTPSLGPSPAYAPSPGPGFAEGPSGADAPSPGKFLTAGV